MSDVSSPSGTRFGLTEAAIRRINKRRMIVDKLAQWGIGFGGISVILAVCLIFFYLLYEVAPLFAPASSKQIHEYSLPSENRGALLLDGIEEQNEVHMKLFQDGFVYFNAISDGKEIDKVELPLGPGQKVISATKASNRFDDILLGLSDGAVLPIKIKYNIVYPDNVKTVVPKVEYPFGEEGIELDTDHPLHKISYALGEDNLTVVGLDAANKLHRVTYSIQSSFMGDGMTLEEDRTQILPLTGYPVVDLKVDPMQRWLYIAEEGGVIEVYSLEADDGDEKYQTVNATNHKEITSFEFLLGGISLLVGDETGNISQWFLVRNENNDYHLTNIRSFKHSDKKIVLIEPEHRRKGFIAVDSVGELAFYNTTAETVALKGAMVEGSVDAIAISPRGNGLLIESGNKAHYFEIKNKHPEVSFKALWGKVWYENHEKPKFIWQSSAANNDFEPKFSLTPLAFGTFKAAFYAMLLAMPLAICGAIFTAYFMAPELRTKVKPGIELMEALPTVILGFLAGLWLAPLVEEKLPGIFAVLFLVPISVLVFAYFWSLMPEKVRWFVPDGWEPALLVPVVLLSGAVAMGLSDPLENTFFGGDMRAWLTDHGIPFDQRNALIVGLAMGFAVIPTIFSITEDAIFAVPKHLTQGSLALGASPWQTLVRVVLPTASPGIFSAVMIGFGRAVGETMIVLMATGNTPIMEMNIFEGFRTLSANIAVEMPEAEVASSHFRILFLAGLVLFIFTFLLNTSAEMVRQHLRKKYGSL